MALSNTGKHIFQHQIDQVLVINNVLFIKCEGYGIYLLHHKLICNCLQSIYITICRFWHLTSLILFRVYTSKYQLGTNEPSAFKCQNVKLASVGQDPSWDSIVQNKFFTLWIEELRGKIFLWRLRLLLRQNIDGLSVSFITRTTKTNGFYLLLSTQFTFQFSFRWTFEPEKVRDGMQINQKETS